MLLLQGGDEGECDTMLKLLSGRVGMCAAALDVLHARQPSSQALALRYQLPCRPRSPGRRARPCISVGSVGVPCVRARAHLRVHRGGTDATNLLRPLGAVLCEEEEGRSIYVPPFLKYAYVQETPMLVEGSLLKNLLLGNTPNQDPCPRSVVICCVRRPPPLPMCACTRVSAWGAFDCV